jgi:DDE superfamily endonuclease
VVKATGARHSLNMISAVTAQGLLRFSTYTGSFTGARFIEFCTKLLHDATGPVYLVVDAHPTHRSKLVKEFLASTQGQLRLFVLPAYSPQLNPTSGSGRTSSTTGSGAPASPDPTTSRPRSSARSADCRNSRTSFGLSSPTPTSGTSPHDQSPPTNELLRVVADPRLITST